MVNLLSEILRFCTTRWYSAGWLITETQTSISRKQDYRGDGWKAKFEQMMNLVKRFVEMEFRRQLSDC